MVAAIALRENMVVLDPTQDIARECRRDLGCTGPGFMPVVSGQGRMLEQWGGGLILVCAAAASDGVTDLLESAERIAAAIPVL